VSAAGGWCGATQDQRGIRGGGGGGEPCLLAQRARADWLWVWPSSLGQQHGEHGAASSGGLGGGGGAAHHLLRHHADEGVDVRVHRLCARVLLLVLLLCCWG
jgi:hypothetical protein